MDAKIGSAIIDSKLNTEGVKKGAEEIKKESKEIAEVASEGVKKMEKAFEDADVSGLSESVKEESREVKKTLAGMVDDLPDSYKTIYEKIERIRADDTLDEVQRIERISEMYEILGKDQEEAISNAWRAIGLKSEKGSREIIDNLNKISQEAKETGEEIKESLGEGLENGISGGASNSFISGLIGGLTSAVAQEAIQVLKDVGQAVFEFGKESIELGSDLQEVQNVVDVTFTSMSGKVNEFAQEASRSAGLSETMAKKYVGTFGAMADSFGFTEQQAYEMSTTLTQLTGDVASFYNLDHDEAYNKLKAVFTGETEALKELGVVMTQTALDDYAMRNGFEKTTSAMSEQEKVALRYEFVLEQLNNAAGDFTRTQDEWANQTRILTLQWETFQTSIGEGFVNAFTPGIQFLNETVLPALNRVADGFAEAMEPTAAENLSNSVKKLGNAMDSAQGQFKKASAEIMNNALTAESCARKLEQLEEAGLATAESQKEYSDVVAYLNELVPELNANIDNQTGLINKNTEEIYKSIEAMKRRALYEAEQERYTAATKARESAISDLVDAERELLLLEIEEIGIRSRISDITPSVTDETEEMVMAVQDANDAFFENSNISPDVINLMEMLGFAIAGVTPEAQLLYEQLGNNTIAQQELQTEVNSMSEAISAQNDEMLQWYESMEKLAEDSEKLADKQAAVASATEMTRETIEALRQEYDSARDAAKNSIDQQIGLFDQLTEKSEMSAKEIVDNWDAQRSALQNYSQNMQKAIDMGLDKALVKQLSDGSEKSMQILNELVNGTGVSVSEINEAFRGVEEMKEITANTMADVETGFSEKLNQMSEDVDKKWGDMADEVSRSIDSMQSDINSLRGKSVDVTVTTTYVTKYETIGTPSSAPSIGGYPRTYNAAPALAASYEPETMNALPVAASYLAEGTVVPPMATFPAAAAFSSLRSADNEELIREIVRAENTGLADGLDDVNENLNTLIGIVSRMNLDGAMIFDSYNDRDRKMAIVRGVKR